MISAFPNIPQPQASPKTPFSELSTQSQRRDGTTYTIGQQTSPIPWQLQLDQKPHQQPLGSLEPFNRACSTHSDFQSLDSPYTDGWPLDAMQPETWAPLAQQFTPRMSRFSHQRASSLSSLGSTGPASPFSQNISNPHIAASDSISDGLADLHAHDNQTSAYYQLAKSIGPLNGYHSFDHALPEMAYPVTISGPTTINRNSRTRLDRSTLTTSEYTGGPNQSHPTSVASSIASDSPATPSLGEMEMDRRRRGGFNKPPKLDRTITDVYGDELYNPNFATTSTSPSQASLTVSQFRPNEIFTQRLNAANRQHLSAAQSPASSFSRDKSPFLNGSPHALWPGSDELMGSGTALQQMDSAPGQMTGHNKNGQFLSQQGSNSGDPETPTTISPKDAMIELNDTDGDGSFPLFPPDQNMELDKLTKAMMPQMTAADVGQPALVQQHDGSNQFAFFPSQLPGGIQMTPHSALFQRQQLSQDTPPRLTSAGSSSVDSGRTTPVNRSRPTTGTSADGGTYTCTYHGCTLRFETPALLQKHKRQGHRAVQGSNGNSRPQEVSGVTPSFINSQAGPHCCDRINPSTGKPCNTVFSRPYDLTRHEDTIHNARKQKVHCDLCTEDKTFSRADALTRHYRVCHPDVEVPGKHRRRGGV